jgi:AbrB family looped-hinge helix DNA binding protein
MAEFTTAVGQRGVITIPKPIRDANNIEEGKQYTVLDLGGGLLMLSPKESRIDALCDDLRDKLLAEGATLESMLLELRHASH